MRKAWEEREDKISVEEAVRRIRVKPTTRTRGRPRDMPGIRHVADRQGPKLC